MQHIGIDLGGRESQICINNQDGTISKEKRLDTTLLGAFLKKQPPSRVVMETCAESYLVAVAAKDAGHDVRVIPATLVRSLGVAARRVKTDVRDARALASISCRTEVPSVHIRTRLSREHKSLSNMREALVHSRTKLINTVRGYLRSYLITIPAGDTATFSERVRAVLLEHPDGLASFVERQLVTISFLTEQIKSADEEIKALVAQNPICQRLMTIPGVGPITAMRYVSLIDTAKRFQDAHLVESYLGLTPSENSSSDKIRRGPITKAGDASMRALLVQAAWSMWRARPQDPATLWAKRVAERRGRKVAIVALARKLSGIMFALWRDETSYLPQKAAAAAPTPTQATNAEQSKGE